MGGIIMSVDKEILKHRLAKLNLKESNLLIELTKVRKEARVIRKFLVELSRRGE